MRIGKDAVSRVAQRLEEELSAWRGRPLELAYPYLYLDAAYFKVNWGGRVVDLALLVAVGVNEEGYREVLVVEPAGGERKEAWRNLLKGLVERGLHGVRLVISDDHLSIRQAVMAELPGASWQRCVVHFIYTERFSSCAAVGAGCGGRGAPGGVCGAAAGHGGISGPGGSLSATGTGLSGRWRCLPRVWGRP